jgi:hypothetical protein
VPFSHSSQLSAILGFIEHLQPASILDVGVGMGQYGFLARNSLENVHLFHIEGDHAHLRPKNEWRVRIDGIEAFSGYLTPVHEYAYNKITIGDALQALPAIENRAYDLVLGIDILEHFTEDDGRTFLAELKRIARHAALISTPKDFHEQDVEANPYENHRSHWTDTALIQEGYSEVLENPVSWIAVHRHSQLRQAKVSSGEPGAPEAPLTVSFAYPSDERALLALFSRAFGQEMPAERWRWKYRGLDCLGTLVRRNSRVVAFYGGMPRNVRLHGDSVTAVQIGDVMVDPSERGMPRRRSPFFFATSRFAEDLLGPGRPYAFAFGFPSERHARLGERLGLYARVDEILEANWTALPARFGVLYRTRPLALDELACVDELWTSMADDLRDTVIGTRDSSYVRRRFLEHPTLRYLMLLVRQRFSRQPVGLVVLRDHGEPGVELVDAIAPVAALPTLVTVARRVAGRLRRHRVFGWMTPRAAQSFKASEPALAPAGIPVPTMIWKAAPELDKLRGHWWLLGGDADSR